MDKITANVADAIFNRIVLNENVWISIKVSLKFVSKGPIDIDRALVKVRVWRRTGDKPLPEPMLTKLIDAYVRHQGEMGKKIVLNPAALYFIVIVCYCNAHQLDEYLHPWLPLSMYILYYIVLKISLLFDSVAHDRATSESRGRIRVNNHISLFLQLSIHDMTRHAQMNDCWLSALNK